MLDFILGLTSNFIIVIILGDFRLKFVYFNRFGLILIDFNGIFGINMGNIFWGLMSGNLFQVFLIDVRFQSKTFWKRRI